MPKIQLFQDQLGTAVPQVNRGGANVGDVSAGTRAIGRLADIGAEIAGKVVDNERALKVSSVTTQAAMELQSYVFDLEKSDRDYSTQFDRYTQFTQELTERYGKQLEGDSAGLTTFTSNINQMAFKKGFEVRSNAITGQMDQQKGVLTLNMAALSELAVQGDEEQQELVKTKAQLLLQQSYENGVIDAQEAATMGLKFQDDLVSAGVRYDILQDPDAAVGKLLKGEYSGLSSERQMIWLEKANSASEARLRRQISAEDRARREADRLEKVAADALSKEGDQLLYTGQLTVDWVEDNREILDPADYRFYYKAVTTGSEAANNPNVYGNLRFRASDGEDVREEARIALRSGTLNITGYNNIVNRSEQNSGIGDIPNWYERGDSYISDALRVSDINPNPAANLARAKALDEWAQWGRENPNPSPQQARQAYEEIAQSYSLVDTSQMTLAKPMPKFAVGSRSSLDIGATEAATVDAYQNGEITEQEFNKQAALIQEWSNAMQQMNRGSQRAGDKP